MDSKFTEVYVSEPTLNAMQEFISNYVLWLCADESDNKLRHYYNSMKKLHEKVVAGINYRKGQIIITELERKMLCAIRIELKPQLRNHVYELVDYVIQQCYE